MDCRKDFNFLTYVKLGQSIYDNLKRNIKSSLDTFILSDRSLDGSKMQNEWFPQIQADVFISHSHSDKDYALFLAGYLDNQFGIKSFIDSCVWGYAKELQIEIDKKYSDPLVNDKTKYYASVNYTASHVHMMLTNALCFMMDKTECFAFLNTPNALKSFEKSDKTESPWIYTEISLSKTLRVNRPTRPLLETKYFNADGQGDAVPKLTIKYNLDLSHLKQLNVTKIFSSMKRDSFKTKFEAIDALYSL